MENISYIGLSQQLALKQQVEMTANNIANMNTPGFKAQNTLFVDYVSKPAPDETVRQTANYGSYRDLSAGSLSQTNNTLDLAIEGEGYFAVQTPEGVRYTRDGSLALNSNYELVNKSGYAILSQDGTPIVIPPEATQINITKNGEVNSEVGTAGLLKIVTFDNQQNMVRTGENLYDVLEEAELPATEARVVQGAVEASNVNPVIEMNRMIELLRSYQSTQKVLQTDHERLRGTIQKLTKV